MNPDLISLLRCPKCQGDLQVDGNPPQSLACRSCSETYPIVGGIPRLSGDSYAASFGRQWNRYDVMRPAEDEATFRVKTGVAASSLAGRLVLDAGCGGGRYACLVGGHGARVIGVDLSIAVEKAAMLCRRTARRRHRSGRSARLADRRGLLRSGVLDRSPASYSRPSPRFAEIARRVKPAGRLAVWLYRRNTSPQEWLNTGLRAITTRLPPRVLEPLCVGLGALGSIPVFNRTLNKLANFSNHRDWTLRVCDNFDWYAPRYQSHHTHEELKGWFREEGFIDIVELPPAKSGALYEQAYQHNLIIGSGVNVAGTRQ